MYTIEQLENALKCTYPTHVSSSTQQKRFIDIQSIQELVEHSNSTEHLRYQVKEERLHIFTTQAGEKIFIQYPGKESIQTGDKLRPYDFRPKIMTSTGIMIRDLVFADMWGLVEELNAQHHRMLKLMAAIFFRLGRMTFHNEVDKDYSCDYLDENGDVVGHDSRHLHWYEFNLSEDIFTSLNFHADSLKIDENIAISLEAFLCFFELLLQNEDSKYYDKKRNLSSGRIPTSDSMLLLSATLFGKIKLSVLLQRFVSGFGVARCGVNEIEPATDGLVQIVDRKSQLISYFEAKRVSYKENSYISVDGKKYRAILKTNSPQIAILNIISDEARLALTNVGWTVFDIASLTDEITYESFLTQYEET